MNFSSNNNKLVILSIPFSRNFRYLASSKIYKELRMQNDVLIVTPGCVASNAIEMEFGGDSVRFYYFNKTFSCLSKVPRSIYLLTEGLRRFGYYYKYRNNQLSYYWKTTISKHGSILDKDGYIKHQSLIYRLSCRFLGIVGGNKNIWRGLSNLFGDWIFDTSEIHNISSMYDEVVIIQTANWGYQERLLSFLSYENKYNTILVPYTTDQILINGHIISDCNVYCPQGEIEKEYLINLHGVSKNKICELGMIWLRVLENTDAFKKRIIRSDLTGKGKGKGKIKIMYTGLTFSGFPMAAELESVDRILAEIESKNINANMLVYRPVVSNVEDQYAIETRYSNNNSIELQWPQTSMIGVNDKLESSVVNEIEGYVQQVSDIDLMIMSATTTMAFDAFKMDIPCIANFYNPNGSFLKNDFSKSYVDTDEFILSAKGMPVVHNLDELVHETKRLLNDPRQVKDTKVSTFSQWDYQNENYIRDFMSLL
jgi:hypothetical protein